MQSWALDFTFEDQPIWPTIICSYYSKSIWSRNANFLHVMFKDKESGQEGYVVEICFEIMFKAIENVRPSSIVINKHLPSFHVIKVAMSRNLASITYLNVFWQWKQFWWKGFQFYQYGRCGKCHIGE